MWDEIIDHTKQQFCLFFSFENLTARHEDISRNWGVVKEANWYCAAIRTSGNTSMIQYGKQRCVLYEIFYFCCCCYGCHFDLLLFHAKFDLNAVKLFVWILCEEIWRNFTVNYFLWTKMDGFKWNSHIKYAFSVFCIIYLDIFHIADTTVQ